MSIPKVSIVMPSLNVAPYIRQCIESAINQTLTEIEIICVDAGSTDGTLEILQEYAKRDSRIKLIHSDKKSYGYQMNLGFDVSQGEYFAILETDDIVDLKMYELLYTVANIYDLDIIKGDFYKFEETESGCFKKTQYRIAKPGLYNRVLTSNDKALYLKNTSIYTWSGIYKRKFLEKNNIRHNETPGASYQDNGFWFLTMSTAERLYFYNAPFYMLRRDNPNSSIYNKNKVYCICEEYEYILNWLKGNPCLYDEVISFYWKHLYGAYKFTYNRIDEEFKQDFFVHYKETLQLGMSKNELVQSVFTSSEWNEIHRIINGDLYCTSITDKGNIFCRFMRCYRDHGFIYSLKYTFKRLGRKLFGQRVVTNGDYVTKNDYYILLDEIHGVERNILLELNRQVHEV